MDRPPVTDETCLERLPLWWASRFELRTVRPWGVNGPPVTFRKRPKTISASGELEPITADGPLGLAVTASSDTKSLHSDSLVYKGGQSGF